MRTILHRIALLTLLRERNPSPWTEELFRGAVARLKRQHGIPWSRLQVPDWRPKPRENHSH